jgi:Chitin recognition protein/Lytic polysaccharide mono-oxygenase, cellulose-degrading
MGLNYLFKVKLPSNLSGSIVLIQWRYTTGNSCKSAGYDQYPFPWSGTPLQIPSCTPGVPPFAEMFWNCAEVSIGSGGGSTSGGGGSSTGTCGSGNRGNGVCADNTCCSSFGWCGTSTLHCSGGTTPTPTVGTCGGGNRGNGRCADSKLCCSKWGWCGTSTSHCSGRRNLRDTSNNSITILMYYWMSSSL